MPTWKSELAGLILTVRARDGPIATVAGGRICAHAGMPCQLPESSRSSSRIEQSVLASWLYTVWSVPLTTFAEMTVRRAYALAERLTVTAPLRTGGVVGVPRSSGGGLAGPVGWSGVACAGAAGVPSGDVDPEGGTEATAPHPATQSSVPASATVPD